LNGKAVAFYNVDKTEIIKANENTSKNPATLYNLAHLLYSSPDVCSGSGGV
jgi:hypothetical protein